MWNLALNLCDLIERPISLHLVSADRIPRFLFVNSHYSRMTGHSILDVQGLTALEVYSGHVGERLFQLQIEAVTEMEQRSMDVPIETPCGCIPTHSVVKPIKNAAEKVEHVLTIHRQSIDERVGCAADLQIEISRALVEVSSELINRSHEAQLLAAQLGALRRSTAR